MHFLQDVHASCSGKPRPASSTQDSALNQCWAEGKDHPLPNLPATLLLMRSMMLLAAFVMSAHGWHSWSTWWPPGPSGPFLQSCFPAGCYPTCTATCKCFLPTCGTLHFPLLNVMKLLSAYFITLPLILLDWCVVSLVYIRVVKTPMRTSVCLRKTNFLPCLKWHWIMMMDCAECGHSFKI